MENLLRHGDEKEEFETGATRDSSAGKGRPSLISPVLIHRTSKHLAAGEERYGQNNWTKGMPFCRTADSLIRHIYQWLAKDDSEDHLAAMACNVMFLMHYEEEWNQSEARLTPGEEPTNEINPLDDRCEAFKKILPAILTTLAADATVEKPERADPLGIIASIHKSVDDFVENQKLEGAPPEKQGSWQLCGACQNVPVPPGMARCLKCREIGRVI